MYVCLEKMLICWIHQDEEPCMIGSAGNRWNFTGRALAEISERLIDYNRLFGSIPEVNYHYFHTPPEWKKFIGPNHSYYSHGNLDLQSVIPRIATLPTHQFQPEIKYQYNAYYKTESYKLCNLPIPLVLWDYTL